MEYTIRPLELGDVAELSTLRRMPGVFENTLGLPSTRIGQTESFLSKFR